MKRLAAAIAVFATVLCAANPASHAQQPQQEREQIEIGLSTNNISVTSDFSGTDLTIFGALDNTDPLVRRQGRYDIAVILTGPERPVTLRQKNRFFGMWINTDSRTFGDVPSSYSLSSTRPLRDITTQKTLERLSLGIDNIALNPEDPGFDKEANKVFGDALRDLKRERRLFDERPGDVQFLSRNLFRATLSLPANVPIGTHRARAYLFKNGSFITETNTQLEIRKSGVEQGIYDFAHRRGFIYGVLAVLVAMITGWIGRLMFQRD